MLFRKRLSVPISLLLLVLFYGYLKYHILFYSPEHFYLIVELLMYSRGHFSKNGLLYTKMFVSMSSFQ